MLRVLKLGVIAVAAILALAPLPRHAVERIYSRGVYAMIQPRLTALSNSTSFAWFDALVLLAAGITVMLWVVRLRRLRRPSTIAGGTAATVGREQGIGTTLAALAVDTAASPPFSICGFLPAGA